MWAWGRYDLGLKESEFWVLTLREFNALSERWKENNDQINYRTALICAVLANTARNPKRKRMPYKPEDFMPKREHEQQTAKQMFANVKAWNTAFGGEVLED